MAGRLTAGTDSSSARLISATKAIKLAGDRVLPTATAADAAQLALAVRAALEAQEVALADRLLNDIEALLPGASDDATRVLEGQIKNVRRYVRFEAKA